LSIVRVAGGGVNRFTPSFLLFAGFFGVRELVAGTLPTHDQSFFEGEMAFDNPWEIV
jgi:hypothetical protein